MVTQKLHCALVVILKGFSQGRIYYQNNFTVNDPKDVRSVYLILGVVY